MNTRYGAWRTGVQRGVMALLMALSLLLPAWAAAAERTVASLLSGGSDPVITKAPEGAWSSAITDKALQ